MTTAFKVSVTQLKLSRPFLKIFARNLENKENEALEKLKDLFEAAEESKIRVGEIYIAKLGSSRYERCRVVNSSHGEQNVTVLLMDCGCTGTIKPAQLRALQDKYLRDLNAQCREFVLAKIMLKRNVDNQMRGVNKLHDMLLAQNLEMEIMDKVKFI